MHRAGKVLFALPGTFGVPTDSGPAPGVLAQGDPVWGEVMPSSCSEDLSHSMGLKPG